MDAQNVHSTKTWLVAHADLMLTRWPIQPAVFHLAPGERFPMALMTSPVHCEKRPALVPSLGPSGYKKYKSSNASSHPQVPWKTKVKRPAPVCPGLPES